MGKMKSRGLIDWMENQGYVIGRKWMSQRLPRNLVSAIRGLAARRNLSPAELIEVAFRGNPDLAPEFESIHRPGAGVEIAGQQTLRLI